MFSLSGAYIRYPILLLCVLGLFFSGFLTGMADAEDVPVETVVEFPGVAEIVPQAAQVAEQASAAQVLIDEIATQSPWQENLEKWHQRQDGLNQRIKELGELSGWSFERLLEVKTLLMGQKKNLSVIFDSISKQSAQLDQLRNDWRKNKEFFSAWETHLRELKTTYPADQFKTTRQRCDEILKRIGVVNDDKVMWQKKVTADLDSSQALIRQVELTLRDLRSKTFKKTANSFFSRNYYAQFDNELSLQVYSGFALVEWLNMNTLTEYWWIILLQISVIFILAYTIKHYAVGSASDSDWRFVIVHPWFAGLFVAVMTLSSLYRTPTMVWLFYLAVVAVFSACILLSEIVPARRHRLLIWLVAASYLTALFFQVISLPLPLYRLYLLLLSLIGLPLLTRICTLSRQQKDHWIVAIAIRCSMAILLVSLVAQLGGYSTLSSRLIDACFKSVFLVLMSLMVLRLARGGTDFILAHKKLQRWHFFRRFGISLGERIKILMQAIVVIYCLLYLVQIWSGSDSLTTVWEQVGGWGVDLNEIHLSVKTILSIALILFMTSTISWLLCSLLAVEIIGPKYIDSGVRDSIKTLLHYTITLCGILLSFSAAGVSLQNFAVVAGALSIGVGFGLQNIVNNFISGLILLFERPIKKGDLVVLDDEWAVVKNIGLRSTVVETYSNAEMIVPNSDLISQKVINLTHSTSQTRIVINIGVAYGSDMEQVIAILSEEAKRHARVLAYPEPWAVFIKFGDSSLDFELRVWIGDPDFFSRVRSEVSIAIYRRFADEGIEIPFPQHDLHLRSINNDVLNHWQSIIQPVDRDKAVPSVDSEIEPMFAVKKHPVER